MDSFAYIAIDTSYDHGCVVVFSKEAYLFSVELKDKMSHGKEICAAINNASNYCDAHKLKLAGMSVGLGPGSFIGVRIALATALGYTFAQSLPLMGFCSHDALALSLSRPNSDFYIFMKASGDLGYLTEFCIVDDVIKKVKPPSVISMADFLAMRKPDQPVYSDMTLPCATHSLGPTPQGIMLSALRRMEFGCIDESHKIKPNYVKEPNVFVTKKFSSEDYISQASNK